MKNTKIKIIGMAMSLLMAASSLACFGASAATTEDESTTRTFYFVNNKGWTDVYDYVWSGDEANAKFPGEEMELVGTTTYNTNEYDVYACDVDTAKYDSIIFAEGKDHGQQTKTLNFSWTDSTYFYAGTDNVPVAVHEVIDIEPSTTPVTLGLEAPATFNGEQTFFVDTTGCSWYGKDACQPYLQFHSVSGKDVAVTATYTAWGQYSVKVPAGTYNSVSVSRQAQNGDKTLYNTVSNITLSQGVNQLKISADNKGNLTVKTAVK